MKVMVVGSGGREHTLAWKIAQSELVKEVIVAPGNPGIAKEPKCRLANVSADDIKGLLKVALEEKISLTVVGPEASLVAGITDLFEDAGLRVFGPSGKAAMLEGSKVFAKTVMSKHGIPTADFEVFDDYDKAVGYLNAKQEPVVLKADGLAAGKGVFVCLNRDEAIKALGTIMKERAFGDAGDRVVIEECLVGEEASFIAFTDGVHVLPLASSQDHKAVFDDDKGPNTGGMGAYSPAPVVTPEVHEAIMERIMIPMVRAMEQEGRPYKGFLYAGLMIGDGEPKALEFNVRMGDPEAQPLLFRMKSDLVPFFVAALENKLDKLTLEWDEEDSVCVVMASGGYPGDYQKGKPISGLEEAAAIDGLKVFHAGTGLNGDDIVTAGGRVLGVTAKAIGVEKAIEKAYQGVKKIWWENVHYRTDIGRKALRK